MKFPCDLMINYQSASDVKIHQGHIISYVKFSYAGFCFFLFAGFLPGFVHLHIWSVFTVFFNALYILLVKSFAFLAWGGGGETLGSDVSSITSIHPHLIKYSFFSL